MFFIRFMHFWIDKTSLNRRDFYSYGVGRNKFIHKQLHHQRSRQNLNPQITISNASPPTLSTPPAPLVRHYQWLTIYVRSAVFITLILILLVAKLYYNVMLSKFQLICFCIISVIFLLCTITASLFHINPESSHENMVEIEMSNSCGLVIDEIPPPEYCDVVELNSITLDKPPSYDKLFEA